MTRKTPIAPIYYTDRTNGLKCKENVYGGSFLHFLYGSTFINQLLGARLAYLLACSPLFSMLYGFLQKTQRSAKKIAPFIKKFHVDTTEFAEETSSFKSFNDFFIRHLKPDARPIAVGSSTAIIPADGRYLFYPNIKESDGFVVKGKKFNLQTLLGDEQLAAKYAEGAMVIARLCPTDYHRYHFPCDCIAEQTQQINGMLYSVNPIAIRKNISIFTENKRTVCPLQSPQFGKVLFLEIGATCVGTIHQTYTPNSFCLKGSEKGYFSFGGSSLILLFPPNSITFDQDLIQATAEHMEVRCLMGQSMGQSTNQVLC